MDILLGASLYTGYGGQYESSFVLNCFCLFTVPCIRVRVSCCSSPVIQFKPFKKHLWDVAYWCSIIIAGYITLHSLLSFFLAVLGAKLEGSSVLCKQLL